MDVGIDHRSVDVLMTQNILKCSDIHTVLIHHRRGCMAKLVCRKLGFIQSSFLDIFLDHMLHGRLAHSVVVAADKQGSVGVAGAGGKTMGKIGTDGIDAGFIDDVTGKIKEFASSKFGA